MSQEAVGGLAVGAFWRSKQNEHARVRIFAVDETHVIYDLYVNFDIGVETSIPNFILEREEFVNHFLPEVVYVDFKSQNRKVNPRG